MGVFEDWTDEQIISEIRNIEEKYFEKYPDKELGDFAVFSGLVLAALCMKFECGALVTEHLNCKDGNDYRVTVERVMKRES